MENTKIKFIARFILTVGFFIIIIFLPAGTFNFWQGWTFLVIFSLFYLANLFLGSKLLERRLREDNKKRNKFIIITSGLLFFVIIIISSFNRRCGWQDVPSNIEIISAAMVFLGYLIMFISLKQNRYASSNIGTEEGQKIVSAGLYGYVRHPMYSGNLIRFIFTPLLLGFYWGLIISLVLVGLFVLRILDEEKAMISILGGYKEYCNKVKWKLVPYIW